MNLIDNIYMDLKINNYSNNSPGMIQHQFNIGMLKKGLDFQKEIMNKLLDSMNSGVDYIGKNVDTIA